MQITAAKTISAIAIAGVAVLGAQYAGAAPSHGPAKHASVDVAPIRNISHLYTVQTSGGTGQESWTIPNPGNGAYIASFSANFFPQGTPAAPKTFSCYIVKDGLMRTQATASSTYDSGFYVGVNGSNSVKLLSGTSLTVGCGLADGGTWSWGTRPLQVLLTQVDALDATGTLSKASPKALIPLAVAGH
jgi:hypothetical protein